MRLLGISCDGNGVEVAAGVLHADAGLPGGVDFEAFVSLRREGPASVSDCALELIDEALTNLARSQGRGDSSSGPNLDGLVFNAGPGGFTAVRSACAMAQGLAMGWGVPLAGMSSLEIWAEPLLLNFSGDALLPEPRQALVLLDARMGELYCGLFDVSGGRLNGPGTASGHLSCRAEAVLAPSALMAWLVANGCAPRPETGSPKPWLLGDFVSGWPNLSEQFAQEGWEVRSEARLDGRSMLRQAFRAGLSVFGPAASAGPHYVRNKVALNSQEQQQLRDQNAQAQRPAQQGA